MRHFVTMRATLRVTIRDTLRVTMRDVGRSSLGWHEHGGATAACCCANLEKFGLGVVAHILVKNRSCKSSAQIHKEPGYARSSKVLTVLATIVCQVSSCVLQSFYFSGEEEP